MSEHHQQAGDTGSVRRRAAVRPISVQQPPWTEVIGPAGWIKIAIIGALFFLLFERECYRMLQVWLNNSNWSHGFLIPLFSLYFLNQHRDKLAALQPKASILGLLVLLMGIAGYMISIYPLKMGYPKLLSLLLALFGVVLFICGWQVIKAVWLPVAFLFFAMPLPERMYVSLTMPLRRWSSYVAGAFLDAIPDLDASVSGVLIEGIYKQQAFSLNVAEACSGMRLMMAFVALGVAMAYLSERPMWHRLVLLLATIPIAVFCNFVRVTVTGIIYVLIDPVYAHGGYHTLLGLAMLPLAFALYGLITFVLNKLVIVMEEAPVDSRM